MSWYKSGSDVWRFRRVVSANMIAAGPSSSEDVEIALPADDDEFWSTVQADGDDIRVCDVDGRTLLTYDLNGWNYSGRSGTVEVDAWTYPAQKVCALYLYFGNATVSAATTTFSPSGGETGYIELGAPTQRMVRVAAERPGDTKARHQLTKGVNESIFVDFDFSAVLERAFIPGFGRMVWEEIAYISSTTVELAAADQAAMHVAANDRIVDGGRVRVWVTGGTSGTTYTVVCKIVTSRPGATPANRTLEARARLYVQNVAE